MPPGIFNKHRLPLSAALLLAVMAAVFFLWPAPPSVIGPPLPSPNGYDDFVKAGTMLATLSTDYTKMSMEELKACLSTNQEPLRLLRLGLTRECRIPTEDSADYIQRHITDLMGIKKMAQLLSGEGRLAEMEGRFADAAKSHLDNMRYGPASANGGLIIDKLVGVAVENIGTEGIERIVGKLDAHQAREVITILEAADARSTPATVFLARDREWSRKAGKWTDTFQAMWMAKTFFPTRQTEQKFIAKLQATDLRRQKLLLALASRVHELETGKRPQQTSDLVPGIFRAIPKDPGTSADLTFPESR